MSVRSIAVIGGGLTGLSAAFELVAQAGERSLPLRVQLFESGPRLGGKLETLEEDGYRIEWAANGWLATSQAATALALRLGLEPQICAARPASARRYIYRSARLHRLIPNPVGMLTSPLLSLAGRLRLLAEPFVPPNRNLADESVEAFAARRIGPEAARVLVSAAVRGIFAGDSRQLSLQSAFPSMARLEARHGSLFRGLLALRKQHGRGVTPAGPRGSLLSFERGMGTWAQALGERLGAAARTNSRVAALEPGARGGSLLLADGTREPADAVILATEAAEAAALVGPFEPEAADLLGRIPSCGLSVVALAFGPGAFRGPADGYGFLVPRGEDLGVLGALWESNLFPGRAPEAHSLVRVMIGGAGARESEELADGQLLNVALDALTRAAGLATPPLRHWIRRHAAAIPQYTVGHAGRIEALAATLAKRPWLKLAGNSYRGVAVGACLEEGRGAAEAVMNDLGMANLERGPATR